VRIFSSGLVALLLTAGLGAQQAPAPGPGPGRGREELNRMVDAYIVSNMQERLALTDEQFVRVLPALKKLQSDRREFVQRRRGLLMEMRGLFESGRATEPRIEDLLRDLKKLEADEPMLLRHDRDALDAALSPVQQAKLRILESEVEGRLRQLAGQVRGQGAAGRRGTPAQPVVEPQQ